MRPVQVGKQLTDLSTRRVIILVLSMMFMMQFLQVTQEAGKRKLEPLKWEQGLGVRQA